MTNKEAIAVFRMGSKMTELPSETLDKACRFAYQALKKEPHICTILGVRPERVFFWRGYTLKVDEDGTVCKSTKNNLWLGLEGRMVCDLINNNEEIMRSVAKGNNDPLTLEQLREMDGEPVWCINGNNGQWGLVHVFSAEGETYVECVTKTGFTMDKMTYGAMGIYAWLAYRRKPEEGAP